jgi:hypothetical protein
MGTANTTRWFAITASRFMYYKDDAGELLGYTCACMVFLALSHTLQSAQRRSVLLNQIQLVDNTDDKREFKVWLPVRAHVSFRD